MPIMAASGRNDARSAAWLLASSALECLRNPASAPEQEVALNNVYRLLEALRANALLSSEFRGKPFPPRSANIISLLPAVEEHVGDVRAALESAIETAFENESRDEAIEAVENALKGIAYPEKFGNPAPNEIAKASRFFDEVIQKLHLG
jgi:hypothetical protein